MSREGLDYRLNIEEIKIETDTYNKRIWNQDRTDTAPHTWPKSV
jgi:hypothetical protein